MTMDKLKSSIRCSLFSQQRTALRGLLVDCRLVEKNTRSRTIQLRKSDTRRQIK
jgi:hypothetical protein